LKDGVDATSNGRDNAVLTPVLDSTEPGAAAAAGTDDVRLG